MNISNIDFGLIENQQQIVRGQLEKNVAELLTNQNQTLNIPTLIGQKQNDKNQVQENIQKVNNTEQKCLDKSQTIKQVSVKVEEQKLQENSQQVETQALQDIQKTDLQNPNKQNDQKIEKVQKIKQPNSSIIQKIENQVLCQTQNKEQEFTKIVQSRQFFMSIKSERSQVGILDQSSDNTLKNNQGNKLQSDFSHQSSEGKALSQKNRECKSESHSGNSSFEENQHKNLIKDKEKLNNLIKKQQKDLIGLQKITEKESKQAVEIKPEVENQKPQMIAYEHAFIAAKTQELVLESKEDLKWTINTEGSIQKNSLQAAKQKKLNLISGNFSFGIDKQSILYEKEQKVTNKTQTKVQPLDIKTLSVLTLSSPSVINSIRPPSPKLSGQRKSKPWQKMKKVKPPQSQLKQSVITNDNALTQSVINRNVSSKIQNTSNIEENSALAIQKKFSENIKSQIINQQQTNNKVQRFQPSIQQLKKNYPYITSVIEPNKKISENTNTIDQQQNQLLKEEQKQIQQSKVEAIAQLSLNKPNQSLVHEQAKNHPLLRHYPIHYKQILKQQALPQSPEIDQPQKTNKIESKERQLPIFSKDDNKKSQSEINASNDNLPEKKSEGSQIINDSSFQAKKPQKIIDIKKRLQELEMQIQKQKTINQQLQISSTFERKLLLSLLAGLTAGSLTFFIRKNKLGSILLALATSVSTFIIKK